PFRDAITPHFAGHIVSQVLKGDETVSLVRCFSLKPFDEEVAKNAMLQSVVFVADLAWSRRIEDAQTLRVLQIRKRPGSRNILGIRIVAACIDERHSPSGATG